MNFLLAMNLSSTLIATQALNEVNYGPIFSTSIWSRCYDALVVYDLMCHVLDKLIFSELGRLLDHRLVKFALNSPFAGRTSLMCALVNKLHLCSSSSSFPILERFMMFLEWKSMILLPYYEVVSSLVSFILLPYKLSLPEHEDSLPPYEDPLTQYEAVTTMNQNGDFVDRRKVRTGRFNLSGWFAGRFKRKILEFPYIKSCGRILRNFRVLESSTEF